MLVPSLKVGTYDQSPEMSAEDITKNAVEKIESRKYGFILINFANADMVGHSGNITATVRAVEKVDECLGRIVGVWRAQAEDLSVVVTADHGNAEKMFDEKTNQPHTAHTSNPIPLVLVSKKWRISVPQGHRSGLIDVAPSILAMMGLEKPKQMTGQCIFTSVPRT